METLIAAGHPAMGYSIRQIEGFIWLHQRRRKREQAELLQVLHMGTKGSPREITKKVKELTK